MALLTNTWEIIDMVVGKLESRSGPLGIQYVGKYDEKRIIQYPAVVVVPGTRDKEVHATNTFQVGIELGLYVYHADLTLTKRERSKADLQLVSDIEAELELDYRWLDEDGAPRLIFSYISNEEPGVLQTRNRKSAVVIGTKMTWRALSQRRF